MFNYTNRENKTIHFLFAFTTGGVVHRKVFSEKEFDFSEAYLRREGNTLNAQGIKEIEQKLREATDSPDVKFLALTNLGKGYSSEFQLD